MTPKANVLLASLPRKVLLEMQPDLLPVSLEFGEVLYQTGQPMRHIYFPGECLVSLLVVLEGEPALEVALVGRADVVGLPLALGAKVSPMLALVQGGGPALRMKGPVFMAAMERHPPLKQAVLRAAHILLGQITRTAACNHFHLIEARLARWLLMTRDRLGAGEFRMTQDFLSTMLGVRRVGVSAAASSFQRQSLIEYNRGYIKILDHAGLEAASCSCYLSGIDDAGALARWRPPALRSAGAGKGQPLAH